MQELGRIDDALSMFEQTHDQLSRIGDGNGAGVAARCLAVIYANNVQNYEKAIYYLQVAIAAFRSRELDQYTIEILEGMAGCKKFYERPFKTFDELVPEVLRQPAILRLAYYYLYGEKGAKVPDEQLESICKHWPEEFGLLKTVFLISLSVKKIALAKLEQNEVDFLPQLFAAESISRELGDIQSVARLLNDQAIMHKKCGRFDDALKLLQEAIEISRKLKDNKELLTGLHNLSLLYDVMKNENQSYLCLQEALDLSLVIGDTASQIKSVRFLASYLKTHSHFDDALYLLNHLESLAAKEGDLSALHFTHQSRGKIFYELGRYAESIESRKKTLQLAEAKSEYETAASMSLLIANIYDKKLGDAAPASVYYERAEKYFNMVGNIKNANEMQERRLKLQLHNDNREQVIVKSSLWDNLVSQLGSESIVSSTLTVAAGYIPLQDVLSDQLEYCKALESEFGITRALIEIYLCVSDYMRARMFYPEAMKYINFAEAIIDQARKNHPLRAKGLLYRGKTFMEQGAFPFAHDTVDSALSIAESNEQDELIFHLLITKGDIFARSDSDGNAIAAYSKAEEYLPGLNNIEATKQTTSALYKLYSKTRDLDKMEKYKVKMMELQKVPD